MRMTNEWANWLLNEATGEKPNTKEAKSTTAFYSVTKYMSLKGQNKESVMKDITKSSKEVRLLYIKEVNLDHLEKTNVITANTRSVLEESGELKWLEIKYTDQDLGNNNLSGYPI